MNYYNFKTTLTSKPKLLTRDQIANIKLDPNLDYYTSIYKYSDKHKQQVESTGSIANIKDVTTNALVFDFDNKDVSLAHNDAKELVCRLVENYNVDQNNIDCFWSGNKGIHVVLPITKEITPDQFKKVTTELAKGLQTFDTVVNDPARLIRLEHTKHPKSGLYKIPLTADELMDLTTDQIKDMAKTSREDFVYTSSPVSLPEELFKVPEKKQLPLVESSEYDYKNPPKGWKQYKWALVQGWYEESERHYALMVIAATCRGLGYDKTTTYHICKSSIEKQARRTGQEKFLKEELYTNIIESSIFSDNWEGGQFSPENSPWLKDYCERMKFSTDDKKDAPAVNLDSLIDQFINYSTNFEQNIIKLGIADLDNNVIFSTSTLNGILGQPGSGKTTVAIEYLKNASSNGVSSMFFSLDMGPPLVFSKLVQKETGVNFKDVMRIYREDQKRRDTVSQILKEKYKNVGFNFRCGVTVADIKNSIIEQTDRTGVKPKLIVVDYLENISGPYADVTANAAMITNQLKDIATELEVCIVVLLQTQKHSTPDISDPLLSMKQIKGSSSIEQNCSVVLTLWREGYNPNNVNDDKYISFGIVKNRFGSLGRWDYHWDPIKGHIRTLSEEENEDLKELKVRKRQQRQENAAEDSRWT